MKINERFKNLLTAFRYFDGDHQLSLTLNEFAQGIEHLRIKLSFDYVKKVFRYLDTDGDGEISYNEFKLLDEENWRKMDVKTMIETMHENMNRQNTSTSIRTSLNSKSQLGNRDPEKMTFEELE